MRNQAYQVYDPFYSPPEPGGVSFSLEIGEAILLPLEEGAGAVPVVPEPTMCSPGYRNPDEVTRLQAAFGNSYVPYCIACRHWILYRFGDAIGSDIDEWRPGQPLETRINSFQRWLERSG